MSAVKGTFEFDDLKYVDDKGLQNILREVPVEKLLFALKLASTDFKQKIYSNMSVQASTMLNETLKNVDGTKLSVIESAQDEMIQKFLELQSKGQAQISR